MTSALRTTKPLGEYLFTIIGLEKIMGSECCFKKLSRAYLASQEQGQQLDCVKKAMRRPMLPYVANQNNACPSKLAKSKTACKAKSPHIAKVEGAGAELQFPRSTAPLFSDICRVPWFKGLCRCKFEAARMSSEFLTPWVHASNFPKSAYSLTLYGVSFLLGNITLYNNCREFMEARARVRTSKICKNITALLRKYVQH